MTGYILTLLAASVAVSVIEMLVPKGDGGRLTACVRVVTGLFLLVALLHPLQEGLRILRAVAEGDLTDALEVRVEEDSPEDYRATFYQSLAAVGEEEMEAWVIETLETTFGIPPTGCAVEAIWRSEGEGVMPEELRIGLRGRYALEDPRPLESFYALRFGCPCYVTVIR